MKNVLYFQPESKRAFREAGGLALCKKYVTSTLDIIKCKFLLCLAYGINEDEAELVLASESLLQYLIKLLKDCAAQPDHVGKLYPFYAQELVQGLTHIAVHDSNKLFLVEWGILEPLSSLLAFPMDDEELKTVIQAIWTLTFHDKNKEVINKTQAICGCVDHHFITECLQDYTEHSSCSVSEAAKGALWVLNDTPCVAYNERDEGSQHVMISYQWHYQPLVVKIKDILKAAGFSIWIDVEQMSGSTLESMASAVEQSSVVIICLSETYKNSPSCRTEAEYAFKLRKDIIPLRLEEKYNPDGWLGILVGTKLYFNCHSLESLHSSMDSLQKELTNRTLKGITHKESSRLFLVPRHQTKSANQKTWQKMLTWQFKPPFEQISIIRKRTKVKTTPTQPKSSFPAREEKNDESTSNSAKSWSKEEVANWLSRNELSVLKGRLKQFDGSVLMGLQKILLRAPTVYYANMREDFGLTDIVQLIKFTNAIEELK